jgi:two-component system chemotaxis response regulator CheB
VIGNSSPSDEQQAASGAGATQRDVVVIGASAGGVEALETLVAGLPPELGASVFVVLHVMSGGKSVLADILARRCELAVAVAENGERIERGRVYVAPPDHHMLIDDRHVRLSRGPRENGHRPAVDPLFRSAARAFGRRVIGVVLSGALDDGTIGLRAIADAGGIGLVQDPAGALYPSMPASALEHTPQARAVPLERLADTICAVIEETLEDDPSGNSIKSPPMAEPDRSDDDPRTGVLTGLTCPECGGALWEHDEHGVQRFKCHVGHAYSSETLEASQSESLEGALWAGLRSLQERADLFNRLARRGRGRERMREKAKIAERHARVLRTVVTSFGAEPGDAGELPPIGTNSEET